MRGGRLAITLLTGLFVLVPLKASAASKPAPGLRLSPLRSYPVQKPGQSVTGSLTLTNNTDKPIVATMQAETFKVTNSNYDYSFDADEIAKWVHFYDTEVSLVPKQTKVVNYSLEVPSGAAGGGYYFALMASAQPAANPNGVLEIKRVSSLVYLEVGGKLIKKGQLVNLNLPWFSFSKTIPVEVNMANNGNTHIRSRLDMTTWRWPGQQQVNRSQQENFLLPRTVRKIDAKLTLKFLPGIYNVKVEYAPPQGGVMRQEKSVVYVPPWSIVLVGVVVVGVAAELAWQFGKERHLYKG